MGRQVFAPRKKQKIRPALLYQAAEKPSNRRQSSSF